MEGTRPLLVEVQALTSPTNFGNPRRTANGLDFNRLLLVIAVLTRRSGISLVRAGCVRQRGRRTEIDEPAQTWPLAAAIASSIRDMPVRADTVLIGEVGLSGELRWVSQMPTRLREAAKLGFKTAIIPQAAQPGRDPAGGIQIS